MLNTLWLLESEATRRLANYVHHLGLTSASLATVEALGALLLNCDQNHLTTESSKVTDVTVLIILNFTVGVPAISRLSQYFTLKLGKRALCD